MRQHFKIESTIYIFIGYLVFPFASNGQITHSLRTDNPLKTVIDSAVQKAAIIYMSDSNAHGLSIGIYRNGISHIYNYGEVRRGTRQLPSANDFFNMGSVAKTFVTTLLAQAAIEKRLSLDDDIRKFLPGGYSNLAYRGHPIRFKDLATHTSGLPGTMRTFSGVIQDSLKRLSLSEQVNFYACYNEDSMLTDLKKVEPDTIPGVSYRYNSNGMMVLILLLEKVYNLSYEKLASSWLQSHLGMYETKTTLSPIEIERASQGYDKMNQQVPFLNLKGFLIGPTMNSTIKDMLIYIRENLAEKDPAIKLSHTLMWGKKDGFGMGLGWMIDSEPNGERYFYHDGNTKLGFNTLCTLYPDENLGLIIMANDNISQSKVGDLENSIKKSLSNLSDRARPQNTDHSLRLDFKKKNLKVKRIPFNHVEVLDNRFDTATFYTYQTGDYPPRKMNFEKPAAVIIKEYLDQAISDLQSGGQSLVLNIKQCRVANKLSVNRRRVGRLRHQGINIRDDIMFAGDVYYKTKNQRFRKVLGIQKNFYTYRLMESVNTIIEDILNRTIEAVALADDSLIDGIKKGRHWKHFTKDTASYHFTLDTTTYTFEQINKKVQKLWGSFPIFSDNQNKSGVYDNFDDFRDNIIDTLNLNIVTEKDSVYQFSIERRSRSIVYRSPWALRYNGRYYIWLFRDYYLEMTKKNNTFCFYVPHTFPDMYAQLSIEEFNAQNHINSPYSENLLATLATIALEALISDISEKSFERKTIRKGLQHFFRYCFVDMDSGDVIYSEKPRGL